MDFLQVALIFLIILLGIFLSITGAQVFLILKDLKKTLNNINRILNTEEAKEKISSVTNKSVKANKGPRLFKNTR